MPLRKHLALGALFAASISAASRGAMPEADSGTAATPPGAPATPTPAAPEERRPLMSALDRFGLADPLDDARIRIAGHVEGSYTYNDDPSSFPPFPDFGRPGFKETNIDRLPDLKSNSPLLNQIDLRVERPVIVSAGEWDVGFRAEVIYGTDARFLHANGLNFYGSGFRFNQSAVLQWDPRNQFDLFQAYVDVGIPVGNGLRLRLGKFESFFGGSVDPNLNTFFSRSLIFASSHPFTFTGAMASYRINDQWRVDAGFSRGWDQALEDNNDAIDALARVRFSPDADRTIFALAAVTGPENAGDNGNYRTLVETTVLFHATDTLQITVSGTYGQESRYGGLDEGTPADDGQAVRDARWYGVAGYANLFLDDRFTFNARLEFLRDEKGAATDFAGNTYSGTVGLAITPFPDDAVARNLKIRPEVRLDYSGDQRYGNLDADGNLDKHYQLTFGVDAIFNF